MAQNYECVLLMDPELSDEAVQEYVEQVTKIITDQQGEVVHTKAWGRRKLEYPISGHPEANFVILHFRSEETAGEVVNEVERLVAQHPNQTIGLVFHADLIKMTMAHYLGMHLDNFQRIVISPASISTLQLGFGRPYVASVNDIAHVLALKQKN
mgnify:CR=1 FL=1